MTQKPLYTGGGVSLSPVYAEGRTESKYVRLIADDGMAITNGVTVTVCKDVLASEASNWTDCEPIESSDPEAELTDAEALSIILGGDSA